ncbi:uncharacterized protein LOC108864957 [Galendromus occidentalis]|uniref:Uncharacterized protein LOC108864957 n=1 Tax=Galendromus occidentalis TaxID=34638 RepID=A0AAJ7L7Q0_9ACAR|nr:uncharacterized protein LOC108864957 [Galendromus occidentalis]
MTLMTSVFANEINHTQSRYELFNLRQKQRPLEVFLEELERKVEECNFCKSCQPSLLASLFIIGLDNPAAKQHVLHHGAEATTTQKALKICRDFLNAKKIESQISGTAITAENEYHHLDAIDNRKPARRSAPRVICKSGCRFHPEGRCRAASIRCLTCRKLGHYANACSNKVHEIETEAENQNPVNLDCDEIRIFSLNLHAISSANQVWWQQRLIRPSNTPINFKIDTGAQVSIISWQEFKKIRNTVRLTSTQKTIVSYSNHRLPIAGTCELHCEKPGDPGVNRIVFYVVHTNGPPILGLPECIALNLVQRPIPDPAPVHSLEDDQPHIITKNSDLFDGKLGRINAPQALRFKSGSKPPSKIFPPRRVPIRIKDKVRKQLVDMVNRGIIQRVTRPTEYVLPIVIVAKQDGGLRLCLDPRYVNPHLQRKNFPMPKTDELLAALSGAQYYTVVDGDSAFWHLPLDRESRDICTFAPSGEFPI